MSDKKKHNRISLPRILDYLKGNLKPKEQHRIERESQRDPFLAEALEGFERLTPGELEKDLGDLQRKLSGSDKRNNRRLLFRIAAGFAAIIAVSTLYFTISNRQIENFSGNPGVAEQVDPMNKESEKDEGPKAEIQSEQINNTGSAGEKTTGKTQSQKDITQEIKKPGEQIIKTEDDVALVEPGAAEIQDQQEESFAIAEKSIINESLSKADKDVDEKRPVESGEPVKINQPVDRKKQSARENNLAEDTKPAKSEDEANFTMESPRPQTGTLKDSQLRFHKSGRASGEIAKNLVEIQNYPYDYPRDKLTAFEKYFKENMMFPESRVSKATVLVRFIISENGRPFQPEILETTGKEFSEEALRLLNEGPLWEVPKINGEYKPEKISLSLIFISP